MKGFDAAWWIARQARLVHDALEAGDTEWSQGGSESDLHDDIIAECRRRRWGFIHSRMDRKSTTGVGTPDFAVVADMGRTFYVECKSASGKLTGPQLAFKVQAEINGHQIHVVRSFSEFLKVIGGDV